MISSIKEDNPNFLTFVEASLESCVEEHLELQPVSRLFQLAPKNRKNNHINLTDSNVIISKKIYQV